jgi:hypothetical protein
MVLDDPSASNSSDSFTDSHPSSDSDPYSDSPDGHPNVTLDTRNFPKPIPLVAGLFGFNDELFVKAVNLKIQAAVNALGRPVSQDEAAALAYWTAKQISIFSYGSPLGVAAGWWRCYNSANTFRFPFYQPNLETFQPDVFPPKLGMLKGMRAVLAWHAVRSTAYGAFGMFVGQILFGSYSASVVAVGEMSDKRLKPFIDAVRAKSQQRIGSIPGAGGQRRPNAGPPPNGRQPAGPQYDTQESPDDASPTGGMFGEENTAASPANTDGIMGGNTQTQERQWPPARPAPAQTRAQETEAQPFDAWDDASPTGGQGMTESTAPQGSAWDRLRRGEKPAPVPQKSGGKQPTKQSAWSRQQDETQREQKEGSTMGDSFAFSKSEEERNYAKEEAQKEFDARVERERRGGDFSQGGGDQRRW